MPSAILAMPSALWNGQRDVVELSTCSSVDALENGIRRICVQKMLLSPGVGVALLYDCLYKLCRTILDIRGAGRAAESEERGERQLRSHLIGEICRGSGAARVDSQ
jgi:hypothetical protein